MISVCMATHNGEKYIKEQLDSILCQLGPSDEVVISDDGSTDRTMEILSEYKDSRLRIYRFKQPFKSKHTHLYVTRNFENALVNARGKIVFLSDQDDKWYPNKVSRCLTELQNCDLVIHNLRIADRNLSDTGRNIYENGFRFHNYLIKESTYYGCAMAFKRPMLEFALPFPKRLLIHDIWIGLLSELAGNVHYIEDPLIKYRMLEESASHNVQNNLLHKITYRLYTLINLLLRLISIKCHGSN